MNKIKRFKSLHEQPTNIINMLPSTKTISRLPNDLSCKISVTFVVIVNSQVIQYMEILLFMQSKG